MAKLLYVLLLTRNFHTRLNILRIAHTRSKKQTMSATWNFTVASPPPKRSVEILDSTSEIGILFGKCMAHIAREANRAAIDARFAALVAFFADQEAKQKTKTAHSPEITYSNIGKTPEAINDIRAANQRDSALLKIPAELLIHIWKTAFGSTSTTRVHGIVCRDISENRILSLVHACSRLHDVLYPVFLSQEAFVVKISSPDPSVAAAELTQWLNRLPFASALDGPIKLQILLELQTGCLIEAESRKLAAELQAMFSSSTTFQPVVYVEAKAGGGWYCGSCANMQVWPPTATSLVSKMRRPTELEDDDVWKGWVVTKRTLTPENQKKSRGN